MITLLRLEDLPEEIKKKQVVKLSLSQVALWSGPLFVITKGYCIEKYVEKSICEYIYWKINK